MPSTTAAAAASEAHVAHAAREALASGNAVDAVVTGVLVAAAYSAGVFLGPVQLLVAGAGAGLLAVDGRARQPGSGIPRPRGSLAGEAIPQVARVGVPALPAALATILASSGRGTLTRAVAPAVEAARGLSPERAALLRSFGRRGAAAMTDEATAGELVALAGRAAGGAVTSDDLADLRPAVVSCDARALEPEGVLRVPWDGPAEGGATTHVVAATDRGGMVAVACYEVASDGLPVPALGLLAPAVASPVMRGEARVRPGEPLLAPAPIALVARRGLVELAVGIAATDECVRVLGAVLAGLGDTPLVGDAFAGTPGCAVAIVRTRDAARVVASAG